MTNWKEWIYQFLPIPIQNLACSLEGFRQKRLRYGGDFLEILDWLVESQWWTEEKILEYQSEALSSLIEHAYMTVPYYKKTFDAKKIRPSDIASIDDLHKLPILSKENVRAHLPELRSSDYSASKLHSCHTSGSTGKSLFFFMEPRAFRFRWAVWWRHRMRFGITLHTKFASFTGLDLIPLNQTSPPYWRENRSMHQTIFTMHHILPSSVLAIVNRLNRGGFGYYSGYPSVLFSLAELIRDGGLELTAPPKVIFTGAETLYDYQRSAISEIFDCEVTDLYGFSEGCGNASRCPEDLYHEDFEYGVLECHEAETAGPNLRRGRVLATGFGSYGMPFIRYDVGDTGTWRDGGCRCGRNSRVITRFEGRVEDYVITPEGRKIMRFDYVFKDLQNVREVQVVQSKIGSISLRVVRRPGYCRTDEVCMKKEIERKISSRLAVEFEYVDSIEREESGKMRAVKSLIGRRHSNQN